MKFWMDFEGLLEFEFDNLEIGILAVNFLIQFPLIYCCIMQKRKHLAIIFVIGHLFKILACISTVWCSAYFLQIEPLKVYKFDFSNFMLEILSFIIQHTKAKFFDTIGDFSTIFRLLYSFLFVYLGIPRAFIECIWVIYRIQDLAFLISISSTLFPKIQFEENIRKSFNNKLCPLMNSISKIGRKILLFLKIREEMLVEEIDEPQQIVQNVVPPTQNQDASFANVLNEIHQLELEMDGGFNLNRNYRGLYRGRRLHRGFYRGARDGQEIFGNLFEIQRTRIGTTRFTQCLSNIVSQKITNLDWGECSICLDTFTMGENSFKIQKCSHLFHPSCILQWIKMRSTCPLCRCDMTRN